VAWPRPTVNIDATSANDMASVDFIAEAV